MIALWIIGGLLAGGIVAFFVDQLVDVGHDVDLRP